MTVKSDSMLVVRQLEGTWQVKSPALALLHAKATASKRALGPGRVEVSWVPREENAEADRLANHALDHGDRVWDY